MLSEECSALDVCSQLQDIITLIDDFTLAYTWRQTISDLVFSSRKYIYPAALPIQ